MANTEARFGRTVVLARDPDAAARWYLEAFAWRTLFDGEGAGGQRFLHVGPASQQGVGVWFLAPAGADGGARVGAQTGGEPLLVLYVDDLDAVLHQVRAAGSDREPEAGRDASSRWAHVRDPLGNRIVLVEMRL